MFALFGSICGLIVGIAIAVQMRRAPTSSGSQDDAANYIRSRLPKPSVPPLPPLLWTPKSLVERSKKLTLEEGNRIAELVSPGPLHARNTMVEQTLIQTQDGEFPMALFDGGRIEATARIVQMNFADMQAAVAKAVLGSPFRIGLIGASTRWESSPVYLALLVALRRMLLAVLLSDWLTQDERDSMVAPWISVLGESPEGGLGRVSPNPPPSHRDIERSLPSQTVVGNGGTLGESSVSTQAASYPSPSTANVPTEAEGALVLLAEDEPSVTRFVSKGLSRAGFSIESLAESSDSEGSIGEQAVRRRFVDPLPAVIVINWRMPGMDGDEAIRRIRAREAEEGWPRVPIILETGAPSATPVKEADVEAVLGKPFDWWVLIETVVRVGWPGRSESLEPTAGNKDPRP